MKRPIIRVMYRTYLFQRWRVLPLAAIVLGRPPAANPADMLPWPSNMAPASCQVHERQGRSADPKTDLRTGLSVLIGRDPDVETREAIDWFQRAADHGDSSAKFHLAHLYWSALDPDVRNDQKAMKLFLDVAKAGDPYAAANVGTFFHQGIANRKDLPNARVWYEVAAKGGLANPAWRLAWMFEHAIGVRRDLIEAYKWLDIATRLVPLATEPNERSGAAQRRDELGNRMSVEQVSQAQARSQAWLARLTPYDSCNTQQGRIRVVVGVDAINNIEVRPWIHSFEEQLKRRLTLPPCSGIESRAVMTVRVLKNGETEYPDVRSASPLVYFDAAVVAALREMRAEPLPSGIPSDVVEVTVAAFYNEMPRPSSPSKD